MRNKSLCFESVYAYMIIEVGMTDEGKAVIAFNKRPWNWEKLKAGGEGDDRGWVDGITNSMGMSVSILRE